ncbi:MAG TPA: sn-glycerol-3-phosphate ABC transporter substrate-binding protein UgpB [Usitatibacter sp.]|nr:sn-glycerol-3-phosphate ABC transporter substrate-binding protein UgpB [Usitatibacter sp.]
MIRKSLLALAALVALAATAAYGQNQTEIAFWHSMSGFNGTKLNEIANEFNASQDRYKVVPVYKGGYPESMTAAIAAYRAGNAPAILQVFEVGTATMMAGKGAIVPVYKLMKDADEPFDPKAYLPAVSGYYSDPHGNMLSFPFNSSTVVFFVNEDAFQKAGLDPSKAPRTWEEFVADADKLKAAGQDCVYTTSWLAWTHIENFSAWHNVPIGTLENGMAGLGTRLEINSPLHVRQIAMLADLVKKGEFTYVGKGSQGDGTFASGKCAMATLSIGASGIVAKQAKFKWSVHFLPYWADVKGAPQNSIIGGASLWVMGGKTPNVYKGVAEFFHFLSKPEVQMDWHTATGYLPITTAAYELTKKSGFYMKNPGPEVAIKQLTYKVPTVNSKGLRFGSYVQGRDIIEDEIEAALSGKKTPKAALDEAVARVDELLRKFEAANK